MERPAATASSAATPPPLVTIRTTLKKLHTFTEVRKTVKSLYDVAAHESSSSAVPPVSLSHRGTSETIAAGGGRRKVLCIWDVDDTLVASGIPGVRQCPVFAEDELLSLFRGFPARHLLLSQGSVDDVFASGGTGKLHFLAPFFLSGGVPSSRLFKKTRLGCGNLFVCSAPPKVRSPYGAGPDQRKTAVVRIATSRAPREEAGDAESFLSDTAEPPRCSSEVRWLVMRPCLWGISLASLSNFIAPSAHTAFLDGSVFRKMDIVRSLAASGLWDAVFFIDNDLTEVGVVRPGLHIEDYYRMKSLGRLSRFFQSDLLLLQVSAELAERKYRVEPPVHNGEPEEITNDGDSSRKGKKGGKKKNGFPHLELPKFWLPAVIEVDGTTQSAMRSGPPYTRVVELIVAHLHMDGSRYRRITKARHNAIDSGGKELWHPVFRTGPACNDDDYADLMSNFSLYEAHVMRYGLQAESVLPPVPGWEPSIDVVNHLMYDRPKFSLHLAHHYQNICHQITTNLIEQCGSRLTKEQEYELKEEACNLFRRLIRRQPVVDPMIIANLASTLFSAFTAERRLPRSLGDTLKKDVQLLLDGGTIYEKDIRIHLKV